MRCSRSFIPCDMLCQEARIRALAAVRDVPSSAGSPLRLTSRRSARLFAPRAVTPGHHSMLRMHGRGWSPPQRSEWSPSAQ